MCKLCPERLFPQVAVDNNRATLGSSLSDAEWVARLEGIYMRMDIPHVVPQLLKQLEQQHPGSTASINKATALYTDADVMFYHAFDPCILPQPRIMAIGPESGQYQEGSDWHTADWNSGVLFINLKGLQAEWPSMLNFARQKKWVFPVFDQSLISQYFTGERAQALDQLPNAYNWKGYWGCSPEVIITHWHGPKPSGENCIRCYVQRRAEQKQLSVSDCKCREIYDTLWSFAVGADGGSLYSKMYTDYTSLIAKAQQDMPATGSHAQGGGGQARVKRKPRRPKRSETQA